LKAATASSRVETLPIAELVDKILRAARPGGIPVEQPTKFDLTINLTTAKALGLDLPPSAMDGSSPRT